MSECIVCATVIKKPTIRKWVYPVNDTCPNPVWWKHIISIHRCEIMQTVMMLNTKNHKWVLAWASTHWQTNTCMGVHILSNAIGRANQGRNWKHYTICGTNSKFLHYKHEKSTHVMIPGIPQHTWAGTCRTVMIQDTCILFRCKYKHAYALHRCMNILTLQFQFHCPLATYMYIYVHMSCTSTHIKRVTCSIPFL